MQLSSSPSKDLYEKGIIGQGNNPTPKPDDTDILYIPSNLDLEPISLKEKIDSLDRQHVVLNDKQPSIGILSKKEHQEIPICVSVFPDTDQSASEVLQEDNPETVFCQNPLISRNNHLGCDISQEAQQDSQVYLDIVHNNDYSVCEIMPIKSHDSSICLTIDNNNNEPFCDVLKGKHVKPHLYPCTGFNNSRFFIDFSLNKQHELPLCFPDENDKSILDRIINPVNQLKSEYSYANQDLIIRMSYADTYNLNGGDWGPKSFIFSPFI